MQEIVPSVEDYDVLCVEEPAGPNALVVFGASGDLTHRKLLIGLFELFSQGMLGERFCGK